MVTEQTPHARRERASVISSPGARDRIMQATRTLLQTQRYADISVAAILSASGTAKGSFYLYFAGKEDLLAALVRDAVSSGLSAADSWTAAPGPTDPVETLREGVAAGARLWREQAPVLRAIVETAGSDDSLDTLWREEMNRFAQAALSRLDGDREAAAWLAGRDPLPVVIALTWLGERVYYLAATGTHPFEVEETVIDTLADAWAQALYGRRSPRADRTKP